MCVSEQTLVVCIQKASLNFPALITHIYSSTLKNRISNLG